MDLFEILQQAGGGKAFQVMASQYGLAPDDVQRAMAALTPAFAMGLKRDTADPLGFWKFMQAIAGGRHAEYYDDPRTALSGAGIEDGNAILRHLFGSKELSRAVADQVNAATGISEAIVKQMLPAIAAMALGGLFRQTQAGGNPILETMMRQLAGSASRPDANAAAKGPLDRYEEEEAEREKLERSGAPGVPGDNPFARMMEEMLGEEAGANPWGRMMEQMLGTGEAPAGKPAAAREPRSGKDILGDMLEPGRRMGEAYQKNMEALFDKFLNNADR